MKVWIGAILALGLTAPAVAQVAATPILVAQAASKGVMAKKLPLPRPELERMLVGHYVEQVVALFGESPRNSPGAATWVYEGLSFDDATGKRDSLTYVYFDSKGKVTRLSY
ncbi:MAG: hypothetical protein JWQ76_5474 [Ramlibacter sp.]|nr:hypothetical protein [Ramlibacter sp.]